MKVEAVAGLLQCQLAQNKLPEALTLTNDLLTILAVYPRAGLDEPFLAYFVAYRMLGAVADACAAQILNMGYELLQQYASQIHFFNRK